VAAREEHADQAAEDGHPGRATIDRREAGPPGAAVEVDRTVNGCGLLALA
jgi:hypothetical protein